jgi:putative intracellular protease/amidase
MAKQVLLVIAYQEYQPIEYGVPKKSLEDAGIMVVTASNKLGTALATNDHKVLVDVELSNTRADFYDGIFFIGGSGALENLDNQTSYTLIQDAYKLNKLFGAICISSRILAHAGVLRNRKATGWNGDNQLTSIFNEYQVTYVKQPVVVDGNIITAVGPHVAFEFGQAIITALNNR